MISIGTSITAAGAIKYFKNDLEDQTSEDDDLKVSASDEYDAGKPDKENSSASDDEDSAVPENYILSGTLTHWQGELAEEFGLHGKVTQREFNRLANGQHPHTRTPLIKHVKPRTKIKHNGKEFQTKSHRAGLDQTISAPKSVTLLAMKDVRVIEAHFNASLTAIKAAEEFTSAKMGNVKPSEKTGKALYATFLHFDTRPGNKNGQVAPGLHSHFFEFNLTKTVDGKYRALELRENFRSQKLVTTVYRSELHGKMTALGYKMRIDEETGAPEVVGISRSFIEANSPRQNEIVEKARELKIKSTKIVAVNYRQKKKRDKTEMISTFKKLEKSFGFEATIAARKAQAESAKLYEKSNLSSHLDTTNSAAQKRPKKVVEAVDFAIAEARKNTRLQKKERKFITRQSLMADALEFVLTESKIGEVKEEFLKREERGELNEFNLDRKRKFLESTKSATHEDSENLSFALPQNIQLETHKTETENQKISYEKSARTTFANTSFVRENNTDDSKFAAESNQLGNERNSLDNQSVKYVAGHDDRPVTESSKSGRFLVEKIRNDREEKSDFDGQTVSLDCPARSRSAQNVEKIKDSERYISKLQRDGGIDQTSRGGKGTESNNSTSSGNKTENSSTYHASKFQFVANPKRVNETNTDYRKSQDAEADYSTPSPRSERLFREEKGRSSDIRRLVEKYQTRGSERIEYRKSSVVGSRDREKQPVRILFDELNYQEFKVGSSYSYNSDTTRKSETRGSFAGKNDRAQMAMGDKSSKMGDPVIGDNINDDSLQLNNDAESHERTGSRKSGERTIGKTISTAADGQKNGGDEFFKRNYNSQSDVSASGQSLQTKTGKTAGTHSKVDEEINRAAAIITAQLFNFKFYGGQLDKRITSKWTEVISKVSARQLLSEILQPSTGKEQQRITELLDRQAKSLADKLKLPRPELLMTPDKKLIAEKLTEIEVDNYTAVTGEKVGERTFAILLKRNTILADNPVSAKKYKEIEEVFKEFPAAPKFSSELEARVFIGLMSPEAVKCDEAQIRRMEENVHLNETAARETATLVQIAYGGQAHIFNDDFKQTLTDEIYSNYQSPVEVYNYCGKFGWQKTLDTFAPLLENIAKQNDLLIKSPDNEAERNKRLAEFVTAQFVEAAQSQNNQVHKWAEDRLNLELQKSAALLPTKTQLADISRASSLNNLETPEFSNSLEAEVYRLAKYNDEQKAEQAESAISAIGEKVKAEALAKTSDEQENVWVMSM